MTKEEFEQLITNDEHKNEILRLVEESICMLPYKDERSISARYEECAQLYNDSLGDYTHFRLNISKQIDLLRYKSFVFKYQNDVQAALSKRTQDVVMRVDAYAQNSKYNDSAFVNDVTTLLEKVECSRFYLKTKVNELEDKKQLLEMSDALQNGFSFYSFKLRRKDNTDKDKSFSIKSEKVKNMFAKSFLPYFKSRFLEDEDGTDIDKEILHLKNISEKQLLHKLVYELYKIFVKYGKLCKCKETGNTYELTDEEGNSYSLNGEVSDWIFHLLIEFNYFPKEYNVKIKEELNRYIKDCIRDKKCRTLNLAANTFDVFSLFA